MSDLLTASWNSLNQLLSLLLGSGFFLFKDMP